MTATTTTPDHKIANIGLATYKHKKIQLTKHKMPNLITTHTKFTNTQPLKNTQITKSLHMTIQTAVLIETLMALNTQIR